MGLFSRRKSDGQSYQDTNNVRAKTDLELAFEYFPDEGIKCESETDEDTIIYMYKELKDAERNTSCEDNMIDAVGSLDRHVYRLCMSIMYQNFMLMRKIDQLSERIEKLEKEQ